MAASAPPSLSVSEEARVACITVFGHSFVSRLKEHLIHIDNINMSLDDASVTFQGYGGLTLSGWASQAVISIPTQTDAIVVDLGANDLDNPDKPIDPFQFAVSMYDFLCSLKSQKQVQAVIILQAFHRMQTRRPDFNEALAVYNTYLKAFCKEQPDNKVIFYPLKNIIDNWPEFLLADGVHFNSQGIQRYYRNVRGAVILAANCCT